MHSPSSPTRWVVLALLAAASAGCRTPQPRPAEAGGDAPWRAVGAGIQCGVSGVVVVESGATDTTVLVVYDNKEPGEPRLALLGLGRGGSYRPVVWRYDGELRRRHVAELGFTPDSIPVDLEAAAAGPGSAGAAFVMTSAGVVYEVALGPGDTASVRAVYALADAPRGANFEGLLVWAGDPPRAVWADRGSARRPGVLYSGALDPARPRVVPTRVDTVLAPGAGARDTRHIADLALRGDTVLAVATTDPGNDGPFSSTVYALGTAGPGGRLHPWAAGALPLLSVPGRKVEALHASRGSPLRLLLGTDDENCGGSIAVWAAAGGVPGRLGDSAAATAVGRCTTPGVEARARCG
jgi:hypothetical protein